MTFPIHTGKRWRGPRAAEIDAMQKRRRGSAAEREATMRLYQPLEHTRPWCAACGGDCLKLEEHGFA